MTAPGAHAAPSGPLQVLGMAALVLLPVMGMIGGIEFRGTLLTALRKAEAAGRKARGFFRRTPAPAPAPRARHASVERTHAGGRYYGTLPRRDAAPLTEQVIEVKRPGRPNWATAAQPVLSDTYPCCGHCTDGSPCNPRDNHKMPCVDGCNDPAPLTDAETLRLYQQGDWGTRPAADVLAGERLAGVMLP